MAVTAPWVHLPRRTKRQPSGAVGFDYSHPFAAYARFVFIGSCPNVELCSGLPLTAGGNDINATANAYGQASRAADDLSIRWIAHRSQFVIGTQDFLLLVRGSSESYAASSSSDAIIGKGDTGAGEWMLNADGRFYGDAGNIIASPSSPRSTGYYETRIWRVRRYGSTLTSVVKWDNGESYSGSDQGTAGQDLNDSAHDIVLHGADCVNGAVDGTRSHASTIEYAMLFVGGPSGGNDDITRSLYDDPYQIVRQYPQRAYSLPPITGKQQPHATPRRSHLLATASPTPRTVAPLAPALIRLPRSVLHQPRGPQSVRREFASQVKRGFVWHGHGAATTVNEQNAIVPMLNGAMTLKGCSEGVATNPTGSSTSYIEFPGTDGSNYDPIHTGTVDVLLLQRFRLRSTSNQLYQSLVGKGNYSADTWNCYVYTNDRLRLYMKNIATNDVTTFSTGSWVTSAVVMSSSTLAFLTNGEWYISASPYSNQAAGNITVGQTNTSYYSMCEHTLIGVFEIPKVNATTVENWRQILRAWNDDPYRFLLGGPPESRIYVGV